MSTGGWIALHRSIRDSAFWPQPGDKYTKAEAWIDLLLEAHWNADKPRQIIEADRVVEITRGQIFTSWAALARRWGWDRKTVRRFLLGAKEADAVAIERPDGWANGKAIVSIVNYCEFQDLRPPEGPTKRPTDGPTEGPTMPQPYKEEQGNKQQQQEQDPAPSGTAPKKKRKAPSGDHQQAIAAWDRQWAEISIDPYPWNFKGKDHDGSKVKRWIAVQGFTLDLLERAIGIYLDEARHGRAFPHGEPPSTKHFDRAIVEYMQKARGWREPAAAQQRHMTPRQRENARLAAINYND